MGCIQKDLTCALGGLDNITQDNTNKYFKTICQSVFVDKQFTSLFYMLCQAQDQSLIEDNLTLPLDKQTRSISHIQCNNARISNIFFL